MKDFVSAKKVTPPEETSAPASHGRDHEGSSEAKAASWRLGLCVLVFHLLTPKSDKNVPEERDMNMRTRETPPRLCV